MSVLAKNKERLYRYEAPDKAHPSDVLIDDSDVLLNEYLAIWQKTAETISDDNERTALLEMIENYKSGALIFNNKRWEHDSRLKIVPSEEDRKTQATLNYLSKCVIRKNQITDDEKAAFLNDDFKTLLLKVKKQISADQYTEWRRANIDRAEIFNQVDQDLLAILKEVK